MPLHVGLVGAGAWAWTAHLPALRESPLYDLVAVCDPDARRQEARRRFDVPHAFTDLDSMLQGVDLDVVDVAASPARHFALAMAAIEAGKHVLCEKPLGRDLREAELLVAAAAGRGLKGAVGFTFRHAPLMQRFKACIDEGMVGEVRLVHGFEQNALYRDPAHPKPASWLEAGEDTGALGEYGSHLIDLVRWTVGEVAEVAAHTRTFLPVRHSGARDLPSTLDDSAIVLGVLEGGAHGLFGASWVAAGRPPGLELRVYGDRGALIVRLGEGEAEPLLAASIEDGVFRPIEVPEAEKHELEAWPLLWMRRLVDSFAGAIATGGAVNGSFEDGLACARVLDAASLAARERRWVTVREVPVHAA